MEMGGGVEEAALKRSTDCVYFLASPLTCKKGSECEYRHSESARLNPKDCWYWQSGSCLNPKCPFRHPPLEGLTGTPSGPAPVPTQALAPTQMSPAHGLIYNSSKQSAPCYYFQQGFCLKGDRCPFMHGPPPTSNPAVQVAKVSPSPADPSQLLKKDSWGPNECNSRQKMFKVPAAKVPPLAAKSVARTETEPDCGPNNLLALHQQELPRSPPLHASLSGGNAESRLSNWQVQPVDEHPHNGREVDEFLAESSPGFDVLVEDDVEDVGYFANEEDFGRASAPGERRMNTVNGFDYHHSDYEAVPGYEMDRYNGMSEYDRYGQSHQHLGPEQRRGSTKRVADRQLMRERVKEKNLDQIDGSDLRHQLLKRKRLNGLRSAISPDRARPYWRDDHHAEEGYRDCTEERYRPDRRDQLRLPSERPMSSRLQGRITLPRRTSPVNPSDHRSDRETDRARHRGRSSPPRPINYQGRRHLQDRISRRSDEDLASDVRNSGGQAINNDDSDSLNFAGPKSLAELKLAKALKSSQEQPVDSSNITTTAEQKIVKGTLTISHESDGSKPLSVMLEENHKAAQGNDLSSINGENSISEPAASSEFLSIHTLDEANKADKPVLKTAGKEALTPVEVDHLKMEEVVVAKNMDEENGYDEVEGDALKAEDDENIYQEDEEELDEDDDFARKVGTMFS